MLISDFVLHKILSSSTQPISQISRFGALFLVGGLIGCASVDQYVARKISPYRPEVQQGNVLTRDHVEQLKVGMTREQVRFVLGTPLIQDVFHVQRWDYVFQLTNRQGEQERRQVAVFFDGDRLQRWEGGRDLPNQARMIAEVEIQPENGSPASFVTAAASVPATSTVVVMPETPVLDAPSIAIATASGVLQSESVDAPDAVVAVASEVNLSPVYEVAQQESALNSVNQSLTDRAENVGRPMNDVEITQLIESWRLAWQRKQVDAYLSFYASDFQPEAQKREAWLAQRRQRLSRVAPIDVRLTNMQIEWLSASMAQVSFQQYYRSGVIQDQGTKIIRLARTPQGWKIASENFVSAKA
jgi:outer membrane protein assembly factor BamE